MTCGIYALIDPETNEIRYIGQSTFIENRFKKHLKSVNTAGKQTTHVVNWLKALLLKNLQPKYLILEICSVEELNEREIFYINKYKTDSRLCNHDTGGNGNRGWKLPDEVKQKISNTLKGRKITSEQRAKHLDWLKNKMWKPQSFKDYRRKVCLENNPSAKLVINQDGIVFSTIKEAANHYQMYPKKFQKLVRENQPIRGVKCWIID